MYVVTREGVLYQLGFQPLLALLRSASTDSSLAAASSGMQTAVLYGERPLTPLVDVKSEASSLPAWVVRLSSGVSSASRITSISVLPTITSSPAFVASVCAEGDLRVQAWRERRIVLTDAARSSLLLLTTNGHRPVELYVGGSSGGPQIIWPMSVQAAYDQTSLLQYLNALCGPSNTRTQTDATFDIRLYVTEFLGKIWEQGVRLPIPTASDKTWSFDILKPLSSAANDTLLDISSFTASINVRSYFEHSRGYTVPMDASVSSSSSSAGLEKILDTQSPIRFEAFG